MGISTVVSVTPAAVNVTGLKSNATGASWPLTATSAGDDLAHLITIKGDAATDHSGKTALITGTDPDGKAQTETLALPNGTATVTTTKYFLTVTSVVPSATIGADTMDIGWAAGAVTKCISLDIAQAPFSVSLGLVITGTISVTVQHTFDRWANSSDGTAQAVNWFDHSSLAAKTASADGNYAYPCYSTRFKVNSVTAGATVKFYVTQGSR